MIIKNSQQIRSLDDWEIYAPPKSPSHWKPHRSAMETARLWLTAQSPDFPVEIQNLLGTSNHFKKVNRWTAEPEARVPFDNLKGEPRNTDLLVHAEDDDGKLILAIEAKADETFGDTVADTLADSLERKLASSRSNGILRVEQLAASLFGPRQKGEPKLRKLRYQLLTATAGALRAAENADADRIIVLIEEFITVETLDKKHLNNARDLNAFMKRISHLSITEIADGFLSGPITIPGAPLFSKNVQLYFGKVTHNLRSSNIN